MGSPSKAWRPRYRRDVLAADLFRSGLQQVELAKRARVSTMTVSRMLSGSSTVNIVSARKIAAALGQPVERYLYAKPEPIEDDPEPRIGRISVCA